MAPCHPPPLHTAPLPGRPHLSHPVKGARKIQHSQPPISGPYCRSRRSTGEVGYLHCPKQCKAPNRSCPGPPANQALSRSLAVCFRGLAAESGLFLVPCPLGHNFLIIARVWPDEKILTGLHMIPARMLRPRTDVTLQEANAENQRMKMLEMIRILVALNDPNHTRITTTSMSPQAIMKFPGLTVTATTITTIIITRLKTRPPPKETRRSRMPSNRHRDYPRPRRSQRTPQ